MMLANILVIFLLAIITKSYLKYLLQEAQNDDEKELSGYFAVGDKSQNLLIFLEKYYFFVAVILTLVIFVPSEITNLVKSTTNFWLFFLLILINCLLIFASITDMRHHLILDSNIVFLILSKFAFLILNAKLTWYRGLLVPLVMAGILFLIWYFSFGKGVGFADVKLIFALSIGKSLAAVFWGSYIALALASFVVLRIYFQKTQKKYPKIPFGPFLIVGFLIFEMMKK